MVEVECGHALEERVLEAENLPSIPMVALKVLELTQNPETSANEIAEVVQKDPALAAKLLKMANSSVFGMTKKVGSVQQAMVVLGMRTVKVLVLSFSLVDSFSDRQTGEFGFQKFWRRSLSSAVGAKLLADAGKSLCRDELFVAGMICDLGQLAAYLCASELYLPVIHEHGRRGGTIQSVETDLLGTNHAQLTSRLLVGWGLPDLICDAVKCHHGDGLDDLEGKTASMARTLHAACLLADLFCGDVDSTQLDEVKQRCLELTGVKPADLESVLEDLDMWVTETATLMSIEIGKTTSYDELRQRATQQLAAMTMDAELGRCAATRQAESTRSELEAISGEAQALRKQANTDALTGIANRLAFENHLEATLQKARASGDSLGLIMLDVDHFKKFNDTYGHQTGDQVLKKLGQCLGKISRGPVKAARYGGEEFVIVVNQVSVEALEKLAESVRKAIERLRVEHNGQKLVVTASLGVSHVSFAHENVEAAEFIERADECLYEAKKAGRNRVEITY
ncbi:MAG: HDOD domain-containing protein [Phycisphaerae bacterium]